MKARMNWIFFGVVWLTGTCAFAQGLPELIDRKEKAVLQFTAYNAAGEIKGRCAGFFISADGIAVLPASLLLQCDSLVAELASGRMVAVDRILSVESQCNLAMVKVNPVNRFEYFIPSRLALREPEELLVLLSGAFLSGSEVGRVRQVENWPGLPRKGFLDTRLGIDAHGAPAMDEKGLLKGICLTSGLDGRNVILSSSVIATGKWEPVLMGRQFSPGADVKKLFVPDFLDGTLAVLMHDYGRAAKCFALHLRIFPNDEQALLLRAFSRLKYRNIEGFEADLALLGRLAPLSGSIEYLKALQLVEMDRGFEAISVLERSCALNPRFAPAFLLLGKLLLAQSKDVNGAFDLFSMAIFKDSLLAEGYLERAKLLFQFGTESSKGLADLNRAASLDPRLKGVFTIRGNYFFDHQNYNAAIKDLSQSISYDPMDASAYLIRGLAFYNIGLKKEACADWNQSARLGNDKAYKFYSGYCGAVEYE